MKNSDGFAEEIAATPKLAKAIIVVLLFFGKICGRIIGSFARIQTRLLTRAQTFGWQPTTYEALKLIRRQHQLFQFNMNRRRMRKLRDAEQTEQPRTP